MQTFDQTIFIIITSSIFLLVVISSFLLFINSYIKRNTKHKIEKLQLHSQFSQSLLQSQLEMKEQTLQHISYELHDNLGQIASLIKINLNTIRLDDQVNATVKVEDTKELVRQLIMDIKSLSLSLNSDRVAQLGIAKALENEVDRLNKTGHFVASLQGEGTIPRLDVNTTIILYRMVQEIINNMVKHSGAKTIKVSHRTIENLFILVCSDDGNGFNVEEEKIRRGGSGLANLQNRAKLINAQLTIESSPENGTVISIELPI